MDRKRTDCRSATARPLMWLLATVAALAAADLGWAQLAIPALPGQGQNRPGLNQEGPVVTLSATPVYRDIEPEAGLYVAVEFAILENWHLYANPNPVGFGQPTVIEPLAQPGVTFGEPLYPPGKYHEYADGSAELVYEDGAVCFVPLFLDDAAAATDEITINLDLYGQVCLDNGVCRIWDDEISVTIPLGQDWPVTLVEASPARLLQQLNTQLTEPRPTATAPSGIDPDDWLTPIVLAVAAGLLMNLMPCVLPIIPIIVMTLINQCAPRAGEAPDRGRSIRVGLAFAAGILIVFVGLAVVMSVFKLLWGQQFQSNAFKLILLLLVYVLSLSMFGLFEIVLPARVSNISINRRGYLGALGMGMLATVLATPCGAPLLAPVLAWSLAKPMAVTVAAFVIVGVGMAAPYVLLTAAPGLLNRIPKAGNWMVVLKQALGFAMLAFAAYLLLLFPVAWRGPLLYLCILIGFCVWLAFHAVTPRTPRRRRIIIRLLAVALLVAAPVVYFAAGAESKVDVYTLDDLPRLLGDGRSVIVKFTANWCRNCTVLERVIYQTDNFAALLERTNGALIVADWSYPDEQIERLLRELGGQDLPFAAIYSAAAPATPQTLEGFYSMGDVVAALEKAAAATP